MNHFLSPQEHLALQGSQLLAAHETATTDLNDVMQQAIAALHTSNGQSKAIIRFEPLPEVSGKAEQFTELFHALFHSIVNNGTASSKPFIYIKSEQQKTEVMDLGTPAELPNFYIAVYTNIAANKLWLEQHCSDIDTMKTILNDLRGNLTCSAIEKTGCLYLITLPGKST